MTRKMIIPIDLYDSDSSSPPGWYFVLEHGRSDTSEETNITFRLHLSIVHLIDLDDTTLPYYHGPLLDDDINRLLNEDGEFLIITRREPNGSKPKEFICARFSNEIKMFPIKRNEFGHAKCGNKTRGSLPKLIETLMNNVFMVDNLYVKLSVPVLKGNHFLNHSDIYITKQVPMGSFGYLYRGIIKSNQKPFSARRLGARSEEEWGELMRDARYIRMYHHANIVKFYAYVVHREPLLIINEDCSRGSLEARLKKVDNKMSIGTRINMAVQAALGLQYLHSVNFIHRDICAKNCLLHKYQLKLADFSIIKPSFSRKINFESELNLRWMAPEMWKTREYSFHTDIFAFGMLIWELFEMPYKTPYPGWNFYIIKHSLQNGYRMKAPKAMPYEMEPIMSACWRENTADRPAMDILIQMLRHVNEIYLQREESSMMAEDFSD